ncbi:DNA mismatch repair protein MutS [Hathewaya proteolytica DSM 3090]|uniref:DNA mismatch repair protein MutS n=2 Tax=Hathewaya proteolytica TaxID=29365 RepID=A0A1M6J3B9_9CLOT|nr:DNA mismatch repair protein MutS [Hathewaya proteolytica DSM 3090]
MNVKENCKDCILFFRLGDFYEMFFEDAEIASKELELVLTGRDCGLENRAPMCGIPYHAANNYIGKLVSRGYKVAICEQMEDPSLAKGIVKRDVIKIVTPGTYLDSNFLEDGKNNFLMSIDMRDGVRTGISAADISTGEFYCTSGSIPIHQIIDEISKFNPSEILLFEDANPELIKIIEDRFPSAITFIPYDSDYSDTVPKDISINNCPKNQDKSLISSVNLLLRYINYTQKTAMSNIISADYYEIVDYMIIDNNSRLNLELTENIREKGKRGTLLWVLDKTSTAMGARRLRKWIEQPLLNTCAILKRQEGIEGLMENPFAHEDLKDSLKGIYDIERLVGKISSKSVNGKELLSLRNSIGKLPAIKKILMSFQDGILKKFGEELDCLDDIYELIYHSICEEAPMSLKDGSIIKQGYNEEVDSLRYAKAHGKEWISNLELQEKEATGIKSLKVGYNKVFGYYIEVTKTNLASVPEDRYIRKQTLSNGERYITPELKEMEAKILGAEERLISLEYELFVQIRDAVEKEICRLQKAALVISELDCISSLCTVAKENSYVKPVINNDGIIDIKGGRHPVVENSMKNSTFVENDTYVDTDDNQLLIITGPNMAGKSTYMRQVALITLMAQIGSFVPCYSANVSVCDRIFTRIGASDDLASGKSTFMVEMWEVSNILKNATPNSLVILDEVGRGTSTHDGLSIAWAVIEFMCNNSSLRCKTLFATHYHELIELEDKIKGVKNYSIAVKKVENEVVFLRKIIKGGTDESYGIEVAKLAGLPVEVTTRASEILGSLKNNTKVHEKMPLLREEKKAKSNSNRNIQQLSFQSIEENNVVDELKNTDILKMSPWEGFQKLHELIEKAKRIDNI